MGASHSKSQSNKQQRKNAKPTKSPKPTKNSKNDVKRSPISNNTTPPSVAKVIPKPSALPLTIDDSSLPLTPEAKNDRLVGIDMYRSGTTPSMLIRDHIGSQLISSLFPSDIPLSETLATPSNQPQSTITSFSSANSSTISNFSDLFSTASIDTPHSSLSTNSRYSKQFIVTTPANTNSSLHVPHFGDGPSLTQVTPTNDKMDYSNGYTTATSDYDSSIIHQVNVAQSKINGGHDPLIDQGFNALIDLADSCVEAYYPLAECYYLGYHHPSRQPDKLKSLQWFYRAAHTTSLPLPTIAWAQYRIAILLAKGDQEINPDVEQALHYFELSAEHNNRYSQYMLGLHYQHGLFNQQLPDLKQALYWYERAARNRFAEAQVSLGLLILEHLDRLVDSTSQQLHSKDKWTRIAIHWLELAAKQNNVKAHVTLGGIYEEGDLLGRNPIQAIHHYEAATEIDTHSEDKQVILAHYFVGIHYRLGTLVPQNNTKALKHLLLASDGDYAPAQRALGLMYLEGVAGLAKDESIAYTWLTKAAIQGDIQALGLLGQQAERRGNGEADLLAAIKMYTQAAHSGSVAAQLSLAHLLLRMNRRAEAYPWFQSAATNDLSSSLKRPLVGDFNVGHVRQRNVARLMVARYKFNGWDGVAVDRALAYQEFVTLSDQDQLPEAHFWVAACYNEGVKNQDGSILVEPNTIKAFDYYMKSACGGDLDGQFHVALMLANGDGAVEKDVIRAFKWYTKAAERGHATAQYSLGLFYERGLSPVDSIQLNKAKFWYERASHQDNTTAMIGLAQLLLKESSTASHQDALHWLHKAATKRDDKNYTAALRALAGVFEQGKMAVAECDPDRYKKGWLLLQKACDKNDPLAWVDMARYHENGLGMEMDLQAALECLIHAESLGYQKARMAIGDLYYRHSMWNEALTSYESIVKSNALLKKPGWNARLAIARLLLIDDRLEVRDSIKWTPDVYAWLSVMTNQPVADDVIMEPLELLGICYELGKGTSKNISSAIACYQRVINISMDDMDWIQERTRFRLVEIYMQTDDHVLAWNNLQIIKSNFNVLDHQCKSSLLLARTARFYIGYLLLHGEQSNQNSAEAQVWLSQAADEGDGNAALELANLCKSGNEMATAKRRLEQGVSISHAGCMEALALLLERTENSNRNKIMDLLDHASELGNVNAIYHQGRLTYETYLEDPSTSSHLLDTTFDYYMKAAAKGHHKSMVCIGQIYDSLEQYENAQIWFERSSSELLSLIMLIKYHLEGVVDRDITATELTFQHLVTAAETWWQDIQPSDLNALDRHTIGNVCFYMGQAYQDQNRTSDASRAEQWYCRSLDIDPHQDATYALGMLYESKGDLMGAMDWFRSAAEQWNHAPSQYQLGLYHAQGLGGLEINLVAAQRYLKLAAAQDLDKAKKELGTVTFMHAWDLWNNQKQYQRGLKQFEKAAAWAPEALVELGHLYHTGFSCEDPSTDPGFCVILKSYKQAFAYYSEAARQGNAKAALMLGSYYEEGYLDGMENLDEALKWYEKAYQWNCGPLAELAIGKLKHHLACQNPTAALDLQEEAYTWFEGSAATNDRACAHAKVMMALYHLKGWGRKPCDPSKGFNMLVALVQDQDNNDDAEAMVEVATCYEQGLGVEQNQTEALYYWESAANLDDILALRKTAEIYRLGSSGVCDIEKADYYNQRADAIERKKQDEREKSFCSTSTSNSSASSPYASRRSSLNSLNQLY